MLILATSTRNEKNCFPKANNYSYFDFLPIDQGLDPDSIPLNPNHLD